MNKRKNPPRVPSTPRGRAKPALIAIGMITLVIVLLRTAWMAEDAYITLRTVDNFVSGHGLTWNVAERVQSYTHPLWMLLVSTVYFFTHEAYYTSLVLCLALSIAAVTLFSLKIAKTATAAILGLLVLILSKAFIDYSTSGLENPLTHLLLGGFLFLGIVLPINMRRLFILSLIAALGALNRLDTLVLFLPLLTYHVVRLRSLKALGVAALGFAPLLLWEMFSLFYYGFPFPNTAYAKLNTGIPRKELIEQGVHYLANTLGRDPLSLSLIAAGILAPLVTGNRKHQTVAAGIALYLIYIVWIGGDFMSGRYLSAPLFCAIAVLSRLSWDGTKAWAPAALGIILVSLISSPVTLLSGKDYGTNRKDLVDENNIADERGYYFQETGLFRAAEGRGLNHHKESIRGRRVRAQGRSVMVAGNVGFFGFYAGPDVHILDGFSLAEPLLARLPIRSVRWRIGHYVRAIPKGYLQTLKGQQDGIEDSRIAAYYDKLSLIIRGDLFDSKRLAEVVNMNLGRHNALLEPYFISRHYQVEGYKALEDNNALAALSHLKQSVTHDSTRAASWHGLYLAYGQTKDTDQAYVSLDKAITLEPLAYGNELPGLVRYYMQRQEPTKAIALLEDYLQSAPQSIEAHLSLARIYLQSGFVDKAIDKFQQVLALDPNRSDVRKRLDGLLSRRESQ